MKSLGGRRWKAAFIVGSLGLLFDGQVHAAPFPGQGIDTMASLGRFTINVSPALRPFVGGLDPQGNFTSPGLFDANTQIGRSNAIVEGDAADTGGTPVGLGATSVSDANHSSVPAAFEKNTGSNREVHTEILNFNLVDTGGSGIAVRAGSQNPFLLPGTPRSVGEVESLDGTGNANNDFPAQSFFDVFVNIDIPGLPVLVNKDPLLIENSSLTGFPPNVVYIHGGSSAVPILFGTDFQGLPQGTVFGFLTLAGHGVGPAPRPGRELEVEIELEAAVDDALKNTEPLPIPQGAVPEPATFVLMSCGLTGLVLRGMRGSRKSK